MTIDILVHPLTPQLYELMVKCGESRAQIIRQALCQYYCIDQRGRLVSEIDVILQEKVIAEVNATGKSKNNIVHDIIDKYFASIPKTELRPVNEIEKEIEAKIKELAEQRNMREPFLRRNILRKMLCVPGSSRIKTTEKLIDVELDRICNLTKKPKDDIIRDLYCGFFKISVIKE